MSKIFGIDLGTTYSCIYYVDEYGKPAVVTNEENEPITPSVVYFETENSMPVVGKVAKEALATEPTKVCSTVKRQMGKKDWFFDVNGKQYRAEQISAFILDKLAKDASEKLGEEVKDVVITCPAYFGIKERTATETAGRIAGLNVLSILNEPTAAALSYGNDAKTVETVLVYDLGGGTFDVTIIKVVPDKSISVVTTGGDHNLGGKDWDEAIYRYLADKFVQETGITDDIFDDPETLGDLELKAETAKKALSRKDKTLVKVVFKGSTASVELTKNTFEEITKGLLDNTINLTRQMLAEAEKKKGVTAYDKILLVGGSTRMPQVKARLLAEFPNVPIGVIDPDESVAKGAAIYGVNTALYDIIEEDDDDTNRVKPKPVFKIGDGSDGPKPIKINNVISQSFGLELAMDDDSLKCVNIITKNTTLPIDITFPAQTRYDNQTAILIKVYENNMSEDVIEPDPDICKVLGEDEITGLPANLPAGSPVDIIFKIGEDGLLHVQALEKTGNNLINLKFDVKDAMKEEEVEEAIKEMNGLRARS
jgi:molecular chaperone DnaK (HSP70)